MSVELAAVFGSPNIGVYIYANNKIALLPPDAPEKLEKQVREVLGVETFRVSVAGSRLLGVFIAGNDSGIILPRVARDEEVELLKSIAGQAGLNVTVLKEVRETGLGNLVLTSDKGCMVSSILEDAAEDIADVLGLDCESGLIAGSPLVGSLAVVTNNGLALPPLVSEEEMKELSSLFRVPANVVTVNRGRFFLRAGLIANDRGALVGEETTGIELVQLQRTLFP
ncbi:MAG: translation initiation factor IF-6 [Thermofilum sp.]|uniref:Translation initiation factor 6 n=1 Tax=Thermofilum pendens TaxID=2269 RepID=A0A7C4H3U5_THEPE